MRFAALTRRDKIARHPLTMRALRFNAADGVTFVEQEAPKPSPDQALIRVLRAGICATDLEITKGYVPGVLSFPASPVDYLFPLAFPHFQQM